MQWLAKERTSKLMNRIRAETSVIFSSDLTPRLPAAAPCHLLKIQNYVVFAI